jgi:hypothetical protein
MLPLKIPGAFIASNNPSASSSVISSSSLILPSPSPRLRRPRAGGSLIGHYSWSTRLLKLRLPFMPILPLLISMWLIILFQYADCCVDLTELLVRLVAGWLGLLRLGFGRLGSLFRGGLLGSHLSFPFILGFLFGVTTIAMSVTDSYLGSTKSSSGFLEEFCMWPKIPKGGNEPPNLWPASVPENQKAGTMGDQQRNGQVIMCHCPLP